MSSSMFRKELFLAVFFLCFSKLTIFAHTPKFRGRCSHVISAPVAPGNQEGPRYFSHHVGELYGGGVVFHVFFDDQGNEQGLVVSLKDLSTNSPWGRLRKDIPSCESTWNGVSNTASMMDAGALATDAVGLCEAYARGGQDDWYLPSIQELNKLWNNLYDVNKTLSITPGAAELGPFPYWSSTEKDANSAWNFGFDFGHADIGGKENTDYVRAIRSYKVIGNSITGVDTDY